jgi:hypothetical protein
VSPLHERERLDSGDIDDARRDRLREFADAKLAESDRRTFAFQAEETLPRFDRRPAGHFFAIHPQANLAIDRADVVLIPLAMSFGE